VRGVPLAPAEKLLPEFRQDIRKESCETSLWSLRGLSAKRYGYYSVSQAIFNPRSMRVSKASLLCLLKTERSGTLRRQSRRRDDDEQSLLSRHPALYRYNL
jgi:hypothetical protein